jgi:type IV pilus assembly protein PilA
VPQSRKVRDLRARWAGDAGFSLVELLVVILIIGVLAAIAIPSFLDQSGKADDAEAKSLAISAAKALESCATDSDGSYEACTPSSLALIEPTLNNGGSRLSITAGAQDYEVIVTSKRDSGAVTFTVARKSDGGTERTCSTGGAPKGGCSAQTAGVW